jgi:hypothetical protein
VHAARSFWSGFTVPVSGGGVEGDLDAEVIYLSRAIMPILRPMSPALDEVWMNEPVEEARIAA